LSDLKKNGVFEKDVVLRKTMFDDCKGPHFEQLLSTFSTIVLLKAVADDPTDGSIIKGALSKNQPCLDEQSMAVLRIAYKASLKKRLGQRQEIDRRYCKFGQVLDREESSIRHRAQALENAIKSRESKNIPKRTVEKLRKHLVANWIGDPETAKVLLQGDRNRFQNGLLERPFVKVWPLVCKDMLDTIQTRPDESLLHNLERRVVEQNVRLERWKLVQEGLSNKSHECPEALPLFQEPQETSWISLSTTSGLDSSPPKPVPIEKGPSPKIMKLKGCFEPVMGKGEGKVLVGTLKRRESTSRNIDATSQDDLSLKDRHPTASPRVSGVTTSAPTSSNVHTPVSVTEDSLSFIEPNQGDGLGQGSEKTDSSRPPSTASTPSRSKPLRHNKGYLAGGLEREEAPALSRGDPLTVDVSNEGEEVSVEEAEKESLATKILSSVYNAEPSPMKGNPSLLERTQLSMALMTPRKPPTPLGVSNPISIPEQTCNALENVLAQTPEPEAVNRRETLAERTRQSMSLMSAKPRPSRRSMKPPPSNVYPTNQFETPRRQQPTFDSLDGSILEDTLSNVEIDYETVFKSRPKIALSPPLWPVADTTSDLEDLPEDDFS
jgi:hypothetical protein